MNNNFYRNSLQGLEMRGEKDNSFQSINVCLKDFKEFMNRVSRSYNIERSPSKYHWLCNEPQTNWYHKWIRIIALCQRKEWQ